MIENLKMYFIDRYRIIFLILFLTTLVDAQVTNMSELTVADEVVLDMKYATEDNFVHKVIYPCGRCFLRKEASQAILKAQALIKPFGLRFKFFDCYRPHEAQYQLWEIMPNASYVTPPTKGSMHNRGLAVDLTLVWEDGSALDMGTDFDYFGVEAHQDNINLPEHILKNRALLRTIMGAVGFRPIRTEWWHYFFPLSLAKHSDISKPYWTCE